MRLPAASALCRNIRASPTSPAAATSPRRVAEQNCLALLQSCNSPSSLHQALAQLLKSGLQGNPLVLTKFTATCAAVGGGLDAAVSLFFSPGAAAHLRDAFLFNTLIRAHAESPASCPDAVSFFSLMLRHGVSPNKFTFPFLLKACAGHGSAAVGMQAHASAAKHGFAGDPYVMNTLVHMYASFGADTLSSARKLFDSMPETSSVSWSAMIGGYVRCGLCNEAVALFRRMQVAGVPPDEVTLIIVLSACADLGALEHARWIGSYIDRENIPKTLELCNAQVNALAKCGDIEGAVKLFDLMPQKSIVSWTSVIDGLAMHGHGREAVAVFEKMKKSGVAPDDVTFIGVLSACNHAGMVDEGCRYFAAMKEQHCIEPKIEHYGCMVDLFSRAGLLERAASFIRSMPIEPNPIIWRTFVGGCRLHGQGGVGESLSMQLIAEDPAHSSNYVLLSNVYAMRRQYEKKVEVRRKMSEKGIRKVPGCSMLELGGEIHEFVAGDSSHPQHREITAMAEEVTRRLRRAGYVPATAEVLLDVDEEDKEGALCRHSERLAIAFALLRTAPGTAIRVVKNLRVCGDCHEVTKLISQLYRREIMVRDRTRFHLFRDGACSCKDFW